MKQCTKCLELKPFTKFGFRDVKAGIFRSDCKECYKKLRQQYYKNNKDRISAKTKVYRRFTRRKSKDYIRQFLMDNPCGICGERDPELLTFDHLRDKIKTVSKLRSARAKISVIKQEIDKCQVLCYNCHCKETRRRALTSREQVVQKNYNLMISTGDSRHKARYRNALKVCELLKTKECLHCGTQDIDILSFHHLDPSTKHKDVGNLTYRHSAWKTIEKEIAKCCVLCLNCHMKLHRSLGT